MAEDKDHMHDEFDDEFKFDDENDVKLDLDSMDEMEESTARKPVGADYSADGELRESAKDKYMDFAKSYWWVAVLGLALIYPAVHQLKSMFGAPPVQEEQKHNVAFTEVKKPKPKAEAAEEKATPAEAAANSAAKSTNMSSVPAVQAAAPAVSSIPAAAPVPAAPIAAPVVATAAAPTAAAAPAATSSQSNELDQFAALSLEPGTAKPEQPAAPPADERLKAMDDRLTKIEAAMNKLGDPTAATEAEKLAAQNAAQLKKLANNVQQIQGAMDEISKLAQAPRAQIVGQPASAAASPEQTTSPDLVVQATIPGRAWLMDKDGTLMTVREGDLIPGYGQVMKIDSVKGTVAMSTRTVFKEEQ